MKKIMIIICLILTSSLAFSQNKTLKHGLGFSAGMISGTGFSYRQMGEKYGFQIAFGIISYNNDDYDFDFGYTASYNPDIWVPNTSRANTEIESGRETWANAGITFYKILHRAKKSSFYIFTGVGNYFSSEIEYRQDYKYIILSENTYSYEKVGNEKKSTESDFKLYSGIGIGLDYNLTENIHISIAWPLTISNDGDIYMYIPQGGIHYYFK